MPEILLGVAWFYWFLLVLSILLALSIRLQIEEIKKGSKRPSKIMFVFLIVVLVSPFCYEFPGCPESSVVSFEGAKVLHHPFGKFHWEWSGDISNLPTGPIKVFSRISPAPDNLRVRQLEYHLEAYVTNPTAFYAVRTRRLKFGSDGKTTAYGTNSGLRASKKDQYVEQVIGRLVTLRMSELNEQRPTGFAQYSNPLDGTQVASMKEFLESWLNARLEEDGITVTFQYFTIN